MKKIMFINVDSVGKVGAVFGFVVGSIAGMFWIFYVVADATDGATHWLDAYLPTLVVLVCGIILAPVFGAFYGALSGSIFAWVYNKTLRSHGGLQITLE